MSTHASSQNLHYPVKAATALSINTVCFVYPNGEVVVSQVEGHPPNDKESNPASPAQFTLVD